MKIINCIIVAGAALLFGACSGDSVPETADAVAVVDGEVLTLEEVRRAVPAAIAPDDSLEFVHSYIRNWVDRKLIARVAARDVNMAEVERLVDEYREELIMNMYRREMVRRADNTEFTDDSLRAYYDARLDEFRLIVPMVKGVYLKVPDDSPRLAEIRRLYHSTRPQDIDQLEKAASQAIHFDYFRDRWIDWDQIEARIPAEFPGGVDAFLRGGRPLEVSTGGFTYLLSISDYLPAGSIMPFEAARPIVHDRMLNAVRRSYDTQLRQELETRALQRNLLSYPQGNPFQ